MRDAGASPATDHARIQGGPPSPNPGSMGYSRFINVPLQARGWVCETGARIEEAKLPIFESISLFSLLRRFPRPKPNPNSIFFKDYFFIDFL